MEEGEEEEVEEEEKKRKKKEEDEGRGGGEWRERGGGGRNISNHKKQTQRNPGVCVPVSLLSPWALSERYGEADPKKSHSGVRH